MPTWGRFAPCLPLDPGRGRAPCPERARRLCPRTHSLRQDHGDVHAGTQAGADRSLHRLSARPSGPLSGVVRRQGPPGTPGLLHRGRDPEPRIAAHALRGGRQLAVRDGARMQFVEADAFAAESGRSSPRTTTPWRSMPAVSCIPICWSRCPSAVPGRDPLPCCYHLIRTSHYRPCRRPPRPAPCTLARAT